MIFQIQPLKITKEFILDNITEETLMEYYLGIPVKKGLFKSPLRVDNNPTCSFVRNSRGTLMFKDFNGSFYGDVFEVVMYKYRVSFVEALNIIAEDFGLSNSVVTNKNVFTSNKTFKHSVESSKIEIEVQPFKESELNWWKQFNISESILNKYQVFSCKTVFLNDKYLTSSSDKDFIFAYYRRIKDKDYFRVYFPMRKKFRFLSNWKANMIQGINQLPKNGEVLVITKSMKDCMTLNSFNIPAIAPNSETLFLSDKLLTKLKTKFKKIIVFYDNDRPGKYNMAKIRRQYPDLNYIFIPNDYQAKDISDFCKKYGKEKTQQLITNYLYGGEA